MAAFVLAAGLAIIAVFLMAFVRGAWEMYHMPPIHPWRAYSPEVLAAISKAKREIKMEVRAKKETITLEITMNGREAEDLKNLLLGAAKACEERAAGRAAAEQYQDICLREAQIAREISAWLK